MFYFFLQENIQILRDLSLLQIQMRDLEGFRVSHKLYLAKSFAPCPLVVSKANTKKMGLCFCLVFFFFGPRFYLSSCWPRFYLTSCHWGLHFYEWNTCLFIRKLGTSYWGCDLDKEHLGLVMPFPTICLKIMTWLSPFWKIFGKHNM